MNTDGHGWNRGFWRSKNVHQTMAWLRGPISDLAQLHPCESVSIRGFFCIVPAKPDPFSSNQSASRKVRQGRKETGKIRTENKPPDGERNFG